MYKNPLPIDLRVASAIHFWRKLDSRTQKDVAREAGIPRQGYGRCELAQSCPHLPQFLRLASALHVSPYILALTMEAFDDVLPAPR